MGFLEVSTAACRDSTYLNIVKVRLMWVVNASELGRREISLPVDPRLYPEFERNSRRCIARAGVSVESKSSTLLLFFRQWSATSFEPRLLETPTGLKF